MPVPGAGSDVIEGGPGLDSVTLHRLIVYVVDLVEARTRVSRRKPSPGLRTIVGRPQAVELPSASSKRGRRQILVAVVATAALLVVLFQGSGVMSEDDGTWVGRTPPTARLDGDATPGQLGSDPLVPITLTSAAEG